MAPPRVYAVGGRKPGQVAQQTRRGSSKNEVVSMRKIPSTESLRSLEHSEDAVTRSVREERERAAQQQEIAAERRPPSPSFFQAPPADAAAMGTGELPPWVLHPHSRARQFWDIFFMAILLYNVIVVPYRIAFDVPAKGVALGFEIFFDVCFGIDIVLSFRTATFVDGVLVTEPKQIAREYLKLWFWIDLVATFPFDYIALAIADNDGESDNDRALRIPKLIRLVRLIRMIRLLRIFRLNRLFKKFEDQMSAIPSSLQKAVQLTTMMLFIAHVFACLWYLISVFEDQDGPTWVNVFFPDNESVSTQQLYVTSLYWAITTITTVGYGDVTPETLEERLFSMLCMFIGVSAFAYVVGNMTTIVEDKWNVAFRDKMDQVNKYMQYRNMPKALRQAIREHYKYTWARKVTFYDEKDIMNELSSELRRRVAIYLNEVILQSVPFLKACSDEVVMAVILRLRPQVSAPGDFVTRKGELGKDMFILTEGTLDVLADDESIVATLKPPTFFGEIALLNANARRTATVRAHTYCDLFSLHIHDFEDIVAEHPSLLTNVRAWASGRLKADQVRKIRRQESLKGVDNGAGSAPPPPVTPHEEAGARDLGVPMSMSRSRSTLRGTLSNLPLAVESDSEWVKDLHALALRVEVEDLSSADAAQALNLLSQMIGKMSTLAATGLAQAAQDMSNGGGAGSSSLANSKAIVASHNSLADAVVHQDSVDEIQLDELRQQQQQEQQQQHTKPNL